jgi:hypothetical protein
LQRDPKRIAKVALVTACAGCLVAGAVQAADWSAPVRLTPPDGGPTAHGPHVALIPPESAVAVWTRGLTVQAASRSAAGTWTAPVDLSDGRTPAVAARPDGSAIVAFAKGFPGQVVAVVERPGFGAWGAPITLSSAAGSSGDPSLDLNDRGDAVVAWNRWTGANYAVEASVKPAGGAWEPGRDISVPGLNSPVTPTVSLSESGDVAAIWAAAGPQFTGGPEFVAQIPQVAIRPSGSALWAPPVDVAGPAVDVQRPRIALDDAGNAVAAWIAVRGDGGARTESVEAAFRPAGGTWSAPATVATGAVDYDELLLAVDRRGDAVLLWRRGAGAGSRILASARPAASGSWHEPLEIGSAGLWLDLSLDRSGNAVAAWLVPGRTSDSMDAATALRPGASGAWHAPWIAARAVGFGPPDLELDRTGDAALVWATGSPAQFVQVAELRGVGPLLENVQVPPRATAGVPARFRARGVPWAAALAGAPTWQFGDGTTARGASVRHAFARPGRFTVTVRQLDAQGLASTSSARVRVVPAVLRNVGRPSIRGAPRVGAALTCLRGTWASTPPVRFAFRWLRDGRAIAGARSQRYRVRVVDAGSALACRVTATNAAGAKTATSRRVRVPR